MKKIDLTPWQLAMLAAALIVFSENNALFSALVGDLDLMSLEGFGFLVSLVLLMVFTLSVIFLTVGIGSLLKIVIATFLVSSSVLGYFSNEMGVIFNQDMLLNIVDTARDHNQAEAFELASPQLLGHVFLFGVVPSLLLCFVKLVPRRLFGELAVRTTVLAMSFVLICLITLPNYRYVSYFSREHSDMQVQITPIYPIMSVVRLVRDHAHTPKTFRVIDESAEQRRTGPKRSIGIMVVGETARADHFSLNGYNRPTNPMLTDKPGVVFADADSCGTSTLFSVPCMFSIRGRDTYDVDDASSESNVLDILTAAGIKTVWIDNNSTCKNVCNRIENENLRDNPDESSKLYGESGYYDEILVDNIDKYLDREGPDTLIVLHMLGSHGPAYSRRYPGEFGVFKPYCNKPSPTECTTEEVTNAYDNTILYTDYVLSKLIDKLDARGTEFDSFLFYASDHGESLGEKGIYLHGLPYAIAPTAQTNVPMILWTSSEFRRNNLLDGQAMSHIGAQELSHDNISHTLMGLYDIDADSYQRELDVLATTRYGAGIAFAGP